MDSNNNNNNTCLTVLCLGHPDELVPER